MAVSRDHATVQVVDMDVRPSQRLMNRQGRLCAQKREREYETPVSEGWATADIISLCCLCKDDQFLLQSANRPNRSCNIICTHFDTACLEGLTGFHARETQARPKPHSTFSMQSASLKTACNCLNTSEVI